MRKKSIVLFVVLVLLNFVTFGILFIPALGNNVIKFPEYQPIDIGWDIRNRECFIRLLCGCLLCNYF